MVYSIRRRVPRKPDLFIVLRQRLTWLKREHVVIRRPVLPEVR